MGTRSKLYDVASYIDGRDWSGAVTVLRRKLADTSETSDGSSEHRKSNRRINLAWLSYALFHARDYAGAVSAIDDFAQTSSTSADDDDLQFHPADPAALRSICLFHLRRYEEARSVAAAMPYGALQSRLLLHISHALSDESGVKSASAKLAELGESVADELSVAAANALRGNHDKSAEAYKRILLPRASSTGGGGAAALNVPIAAAYHCGEYYDIAGEVLDIYTATPAGRDSVLALNLAAANTYRISGGRAAEAHLQRALPHPYREALAAGAPTLHLNGQTGTGATARHLSGPPPPVCDPLSLALLDHNLAVYRGGAGGVRTWGALLSGEPSRDLTSAAPSPASPCDALPEARLNLLALHLRAAWGEAGRDGDPQGALSLAPPPYPFPVHVSPLCAAMPLMTALGHEPRSPHELSLAGVLHMSLGLACAAALRVHAAGHGGALFSSAAVAASAQLLSLPGLMQPPLQHIRTAQNALHSLGASPLDTDTLPGRRAMGLCLLLLGQPDSAHTYLASVGPYAAGDSGYAANVGVALAASGAYAEAARAFESLPDSPALRHDPLLLAWRTRAWVLGGQPSAAWEAYLRLRQDAAEAARGGATDPDASLGASAGSLALAHAGHGDALSAGAGGVDRHRLQCAQVAVMRVMSADCFKGAWPLPDRASNTPTLLR